LGKTKKTTEKLKKKKKKKKKKGRARGKRDDCRLNNPPSKPT
jgi:hypothetical protein